MKKILQFVVVVAVSNCYSQPGSLDSSFGIGGKVVTSINSGADKAYSVALESDGKIVVAGMTTNSSTGKDFVCIRYNSDGSLDSTFGVGGIFVNDLQTGSDDVAYSVAIQSDGKIVLAGYSDDGNNKSAALIRLDATGVLDNSFGTSGKVLTDFITGRADEIKSVKIHSLTGNIVVGGTSSLTSTNSQAVIARYTSSGLLDNTFNTTGKVLLADASGTGTYYYVIEDLSIKSNGKISAVGWINQQGAQWSANHYACRLNNDGTLDTSFSTDGLIVTNGGFNSEDKTFSMILKSDDSILFSGGGHLSTLEYDYFLGLYDSTGTTVAGKASFDYGPLIKDVSYAMGIDSTGKIVLAGSNVSSVTNSTFGIARVNADYTKDSTFGSSGKVITTFGTNSSNEAFDMAIQSDDKIVVVGYTGNDFALARYNSAPLSNKEFEYNKQIGLYPNPAKNQLYINLKINELFGKEYKILDTNGRIVLKGNLNSESNQINIENLKSGLYIFNLENINQKFIKD